MQILQTCKFYKLLIREFVEFALKFVGSHYNYEVTRFIQKENNFGNEKKIRLRERFGSA